MSSAERKKIKEEFEKLNTEYHKYLKYATISTFFNELKIGDVFMRYGNSFICRKTSKENYIVYNFYKDGVIKANPNMYVILYPNEVE